MIQNFLSFLWQYCPDFLKRPLKQSGISRAVWNIAAPASPYEPDLLRLIQEVVRPGWICADIGANVGTITALLAERVTPSGLVYAFEAHPKNAETLRRNLKEEQIGNAKVENLIVADGSQQRMWLYPGRQHSEAEWNIMGHDVEGNETERELSVPAVSLDEYFPPGARLNFVKIDVEGAEGMVIKGMRRILQEARPVVFVEFHDDHGWAGRKYLFEAGYDLYDMNRRLQQPLEDAPRIYHCYFVHS
jgi:FkbM family methyltransferase